MIVIYDEINYFYQEERMGDIGPARRKIDFEPFPESVPVQEPAAPSTPAPERTPEKVPA